MRLLVAIIIFVGVVVSGAGWNNWEAADSKKPVIEVDALPSHTLSLDPDDEEDDRVKPIRRTRPDPGHRRAARGSHPERG